MKTKIPTLAIALGVAILRVATCLDELNQSDLSTNNELPIEMQDARQGRVETPEVVLQLKYDGGELNRIYLAQFRKNPRDWESSVPTRTNICTDLCHAGLGGEGCGSSCQDLIPVGLNSALQQDSNTTLQHYGEPRTSVCPVLCANMLGDPLCSCSSLPVEQTAIVDWPAVCGAFCISDRYVLGGCPACDSSITSAVTVAHAASRVLSSVEGWSAWCDVQCRLGQGGAACNCDRTPFL